MKIKKQKAKKVCHRILKFQDYKNCLEASQTKNRISHLEQKKLL